MVKHDILHELLSNSPETTYGLAKALGKDRNTVRGRVSDLIKEDLIIKIDDRGYELTDSGVIFVTELLAIQREKEKEKAKPQTKEPKTIKITKIAQKPKILKDKVQVKETKKTEKVEKVTPVMTNLSDETLKELVFLKSALTSTEISELELKTKVLEGVANIFIEVRELQYLAKTLNIIAKDINYA